MTRSCAPSPAAAAAARGELGRGGVSECDFHPVLGVVSEEAALFSPQSLRDHSVGEDPRAARTGQRQ